MTIRHLLFKCAPFRFFPLQNTIIFESAPALSDNTKAVFDEMIRRGINKKYKIVWFLYGAIPANLPQIDNVHYVEMDKNLLQRMWYHYTAKYLISCNRFISKLRKRQISFYLTHGVNIKETKAYYYCPEGIDYLLTTGEKAVDIMADQLRMPKEKCIPLGFARNDELFDTFNLEQYFGKYEKYVVWYPTVRQFKSGMKSGSAEALPLIYNLENANRINEIAQRCKTLIIIKPHFAQDVSYIKKAALSNIVFIDDGFFKEHAISSYQFVGSTDALLTDYSSIYYDYLLCNKPIGLIWEDIEEYKKNPGLISNYEYYMQGGEKIYSIDELCGFIERVYNGADKLKVERQTICKEINVSQIPDNAQRVTDFILKKFK